VSRLRDLGRRALDAALEFSVVGSFSRIGPAIRRRLFHWAPITGQPLVGQVIIVSGSTSGLGLECARQLARLGASVVLLVRDPDAGSRICKQIVASTGNPDVSVVVADLSDLDSVRRAASQLRRYPAIQGLVHNAGALTKDFRVTAEGLEVTAATQLVGPFLLTTLLLDQLQAGRARVVWVTSGGMYTQPLDVRWLENPESDYSGAVAYARVKRAQVSLNAVWAPSLATRGITMTAMHPGWVDTPGVRQSLPRFGRVMSLLLRTPSEGVDTTVWLLVTPVELTPPGTLWLDRRSRQLHRLRRTRRSDTELQRQRLLSFCRTRSGCDFDRT
jgi:NAD(P)-dependent dehydrogenase (short-subunit alcohol dehydrogenase family)